MGPTRKRGPYPEPALPQHYNAEAIALIEGTGGSIVHLPPYGEYLNPVELLSTT